MNPDFDGLMLHFRKETFVHGALCRGETLLTAENWQLSPNVYHRP